MEINGVHAGMTCDRLLRSPLRQRGNAQSLDGAAGMRAECALNHCIRTYGGVKLLGADLLYEGQ
jgi:hypothetical protein